MLQRAAALVCVLFLFVVPTLAEDAPESWIEQVTEGTAAQEYQFSWDVDGALTAPNRAQGLRARVGPQGLQVTPRVESRDYRLELNLVRVGRAENEQEVGAGIVAANGTRAEIRRGGLTEWFVNRPEGLEHGFTVPRPPHGDGRVVVVLRVGGNMLAYPQGYDGHGVEFRDAQSQPALVYDGLVVKDATGQRLPAHFGLGPSELRIEVDDAGAVYPIEIDPNLKDSGWTARGHWDSDRFGESVSTAGDLNGDGYSDVVVATPNAYNDALGYRTGGVFVYYGSASGLASVTDGNWRAFGTRWGDAMGFSVSPGGDINGDGFGDLVVGAPIGLAVSGRVFVYYGSASGLGTTPQILEGFSSGFGRAVAGAGDVNGDGYDDVVVGDPLYPEGTSADDGRAYLYYGSAGGLTAGVGWTGSGLAGSRYGCSVSRAGDVDGNTYGDVLVGACTYSSGQIDEGAVYAYYGSGGGLSTSPNWLKEVDRGQAQFGFDVANAGDVNGDGFADVIIGAPYWWNGPTYFAGRVYVFPGSAGGLGASPLWVKEYMPDVWQDMLGYSVGTAGDVNGDGFADIVVGAPQRWDSPHDLEGWAYLYLGSAFGPSYTEAWIGQSNEYGAEYGNSVGTAGDVNGDGLSDVLVGAHLMNGTTTVDCGRAFLYYGAASGTLAAGMGINGSQSWARMGYSISAAGDVDGDGFSDFLVGTPLWDGGETDEGRADLYRGQAGGPSSIPAWTQEGNQSGAHYGEATATAGDVNGDGYADVLVGAPAFDNGHVDEGKAWLYLGGAGGLGTAPSWSVEGDGTNYLLGTSLGTAGDVNADGFADVAVGIPGAPGTLYNNTGRVWVYHGRASGLPATESASFGGTWNVSAKFGTSVSAAGDVNRDGFSDLVVGAPEDSGGGSASVFHGSSSGLAFAVKIGQGFGSWTRYGMAVASAGDVNGDGYGDVLTGAPRYGTLSSYDGRGFLYLGGPSGVTNSAAWTVTGSAGAQLGATLASADVNGDGYTDVLIGENAVNSYAGRASLYLGSSSGLVASAAWTLDGGTSTSLSRGMAGVGDINGDGYEDVVIGSAYTDVVAEDGGWFAIYYGNAMNGAAWQPRQWRFDGAAPIAPMGAGDRPDQFRVRLTGRSAAGRSEVRMVAEVHAQGVPFDMQGMQSSAAYWTSYPGSGGSVAPFDLAAAAPGTAPLVWRARVVDRDPYFGGSRWFRLPDGSSTQPDLRTCPYRWRDADGDGYGDANLAIIACVEVGGYVANNTDCNDGTAAAFPGNPEVCDGLDNNCDYAVDNAPVPRSLAHTWAEKDGTAIRLMWDAVSAATAYDLVRGRLLELRNNAGDYSVSPQTCLANDTTSTQFTDGASSPSGGVLWYLVRPVSCGGPGSYDDEHSAPRDAEIAANGSHCP